MLFLDKYRPKKLEELDIHKKLTPHLKELAETEDLPHLLFYGPSGAGKKTRILSLLREMYGPQVENLSMTQREFSFKSGGKTELTVLSSPFHIELNPSDAGVNDRKVIQEIIKEIASSAPIIVESKSTLESQFKKTNQKEKPKTNTLENTQKKRDFKVVILSEVDQLTKEAQQALRRTMEKYTRTCRIFMDCINISGIIDPLKSRCLGIRIPSPSSQEIKTVLYKTCKKEGIKLPNYFADTIIEKSEFNLRKALLILESAKMDQYPFSQNQTIQPPDWEKLIIKMAHLMIEEQSPARLLILRNSIFELLTHCIPPDLIFKKLTLELIQKVGGEMQKQVIIWAAFFEHRSKLGTKPIIHIEAFMAKFMSLYKQFLSVNFN
ncbi:replication factor c subunit 3 [Anaeramoeba ignava]|uniref:Replication factor c subunit 3 n=1 Tax=Anaeramoeba ignava TaxID=1746090 RepID=A0A9Q0LGI9_ANAIG|nr:replication factor c subunit 3 [Anaeramoeba ignava]